MTFNVNDENEIKNSSENMGEENFLEEKKLDTKTA